jgi:hypothetical protein
VAILDDGFGFPFIAIFLAFLNFFVVVILGYLWRFLAISGYGFGSAYKSPVWPFGSGRLPDPPIYAASTLTAT